MIFKAADPFNPPHGRIDGVIYYGAFPMPLPLVPVAYDADAGSLWIRQWDGTSWELITVPLSALPAAAVPLFGLSAAQGAPGFITLSDARVQANAIMVLSLLCDSGEDSFNNAVVGVGPARDGEFDVFTWGAGFDSSYKIAYTFQNP